MNLAISQNRHILSMIGIPVWASRTHATKRVPVMGDRLGKNPTIDELVDIGVSDNSRDDVYEGQDDGDGDDYDNYDNRDGGYDDVVAPSYAPNDVVATPPITEQPITERPSTPQQVATPPIPTPILIPKLDIRYHLKGVRFGQWVLVLDMQYVDTDVHSVWLSLCEALERQAQTANLPYRTHEIDYPLVKDEYIEHQDFAPANQACLGFVLGLAMPDVASVHIGLLTPLTEGLGIKNAYTLTDIRLLAKYSEQKRAFWTFVNQA